MTDDFREQARRIVAEHAPKNQGPLDVFDFASLAANLGWDVEKTVPVMAEDYAIDEDSARELLLGARSERLGRDIEDEEDE